MPKPMPDLLKLPLRLVDYGTRPARYVFGKLLELRHTDDDIPPAAPARETERSRPEPPQTAPKERAPARKPSPKAVRRATRHEPTHGEAAAIRAKDHPTGPSIEVAAPWEHYDSMTEDQVLDRLSGADATVRAMVRLYEAQHGGRRQILIATEDPVAT